MIDAVVVRDLLREQGVTASVRTVQRAVEERRRRMNAGALATVRFESSPGEQMQAGLGEKRMRIGGERLKVIFSVAVRSYSRRIFVKVVRAGRVGRPSA